MGPETADRRAAESSLLWWLLASTGVLVAALGGYAGFRVAASLDLAEETGVGLLALGTVTGFAVVFSPCSFPLLVGMLAGPVGSRGDESRRHDGVKAALAVGAGAALFLILAGVVVGLAGEGLATQVGFSTAGGRLLRVGVAGVVLVSGLVQLGLVSVPLGRLARIAAPIERHRVSVAADHRRSGQAIYGFGFVLAGFG